MQLSHHSGKNKLSYKPKQEIARHKSFKISKLEI